MAWLTANWAMVVAVLLGISEALALIPQVQANSIFQLFVSMLKALAGKKDQTK